MSEIKFEIGELNHITFAVENIDKSIEFYQKVFNANLMAQGENLAYFDISGIWIALNVEKNIPSNKRQNTYTHIAFSMTESDQEEFIKHLNSINVEYTRGRIRSIREGQSVYVRDYDGHLFEFHSRTRKDRLEYYHDERDDIVVL